MSKGQYRRMAALGLILAISLALATASIACDLSTGDFDCDGATIIGQDSQDKQSDDASFRNATLVSCSLVRTNLPNADFYGASLTDVAFVLGSLKEASFFGAKIYEYRWESVDCNGVDLEEAYMEFGIVTNTLLRNSNWKNYSSNGQSEFSNSDMTGANFEHASMVNHIYTNVTMDGIQAMNTTWSQCSFSSVTMSDAVWNGSRVTISVFDRLSSVAMSAQGAIFQQSEFRNSVIRNADWYMAEMSDINSVQTEFLDSRFSMMKTRAWSGSMNIFSNCVFDRADAFRLTWENSSSNGGSYQSASFTYANFNYHEMTNDVFDFASFTGGRFYMCKANSTSFKNINATQLGFVECMFEGVNFDDSHIIEGSFAGSRDMRGEGSVSFRNATLTRTSFRGAALQYVVFQGAVLTEAQLHGISAPFGDFQNVNGQRASFEPIPVGLESLRPSDLTFARFDNADLRYALFSYANLTSASFQNSNLREASFRDADVRNVDWQGADLTGADFSKAIGLNPNCATFCVGRGCVCDTIPTCPNGQEPGADVNCSNAVIRNFKYTGVSFAGINLQDAALNHVGFESMLLIRANMKGVRMSNFSYFESVNALNASFNEAKIENVDILGTILKHTDWTGTEFRGINLISGADMTDAKFENVNIEGAFVLENTPLHEASLANLNRVGAATVEFKNLNGVGTNGNGISAVASQWISGIFVNSTFRNSNLIEATFRSIVFENCDFEGAQFAAVSMIDASFPASNMNLIDFSDSIISETSFRNTNLKAASFNGANLTLVNFTNAILIDSQFLGASISDDCQFTGANCSGIVLDNDESCEAFCASRNCYCTLTLEPSSPPGPSRTPTLQPSVIASHLPSHTPSTLQPSVSESHLPSHTPSTFLPSPTHTPALVSQHPSSVPSIASFSPGISVSITATPVGPSHSVTAGPEESETPTSSGSEPPEPSATPVSSASLIPSVTITATPEDNPCFPASAKVRLESGVEVRMDDLSLGAKIQVPGKIIGKMEYSEVYLFGHRLRDTYAEYVVIGLENSKSLAVSPNHYVYANNGKKLKLAKNVQVGDTMMLDSLEVVAVISLERRFEKGVYNPHTLDGDLFVDGVKVSSYTSLVPPVLGHILLAPARTAYRVFRWNLLGGLLEQSMPGWVYEMIIRAARSVVIVYIK